MSVKLLNVTPRADDTALFQFEVSEDFDIANDTALFALLSNGTPVNMSNDLYLETTYDLFSKEVDVSQVFIHDTLTGIRRSFDFV